MMTNQTNIFWIQTINYDVNRSIVIAAVQREEFQVSFRAAIIWSRTSIMANAKLNQKNWLFQVLSICKACRCPGCVCWESFDVKVVFLIITGSDVRAIRQFSSQSCQPGTSWTKKIWLLFCLNQKNFKKSVSFDKKILNLNHQTTEKC